MLLNAKATLVEMADELAHLQSEGCLNEEGKKRLKALEFFLNTLKEEGEEETMELTKEDGIEVLQSSYIAMDIFTSCVQEHPFVRQNPELRDLVDNANEALYDVYNKIGELVI